jgi:hypothetical protein
MSSRPANADIGEATAAALEALPPSWAVVRDPVWPRDQFPAIDHIVIGPPGIFVIDTRSWSGRVGVERGSLWQDGQDRTALLRTTAEAAVSVSGLAPSVRFDYVHGVICLAERDVGISWVDGVLVCSTRDLVAELTSYVEVIPGGVSKAVAVDVERRLKEGKPRTRPKAAKQPKQPKQPKQTKPAGPAGERPRRRRTPTAAGVAATLAVVAVLLAVSPSFVSDMPGEIAELVENVTNENDNPLDTKTPKHPIGNKKQDQQERRGG